MGHKNKAEKVRERTYEDMLYKLSMYNKCALIRPTGFGKTWMLTRLLSEKGYKSILYCYPIQIIASTVANRYLTAMDDEDAYDAETVETMQKMQEISNVTLMSYQKLCRLNEQELSEMHFDLIIFDEAHRLGGPMTKRMVSKLFANNPDAHFVGATATPNRTDAFDPVHTFFNDITVFEYNLHDAFQDGILQKPYYCYCTYDVMGNIKNALKENMKEAAFTAGEDINNLTVQEVYSKHLIEISNIFNMENIIRDTCTECLPDTSYMKFIVFFSKMKQMDEKLRDVVTWFRNAFPEHAVETMVITSQDTVTRANMEKLDSMAHVEGKIDLICCIDMLNMGYHVDDLSGIFMYRGTSSDIIYIQQLGRALSSGSADSCVVFDVVDNLHRKAVFDLQVSVKKAAKKKAKKKATTVSMNWRAHDDGTVTDPDGHPAPYTVKDGEVYALTGQKTDFIVNEEGLISDSPGYKIPDWKLNADAILPEDLRATGHEATEREFFARVLAEQLWQRCRRAAIAHFRTWCHCKAVQYPLNEKEDERMVADMSMSNEEFRKEFRGVVAENRLEYPLLDAKKLISNSWEKYGVPPMECFAKWQNISIPQILDLLGIQNTPPENPDGRMKKAA